MTFIGYWLFGIAKNVYLIKRNPEIISKECLNPSAPYFKQKSTRKKKTNKINKSLENIFKKPHETQRNRVKVRSRIAPQVKWLELVSYCKSTWRSLTSSHLNFPSCFFSHDPEMVRLGIYSSAGNRSFRLLFKIQSCLHRASKTVKWIGETPNLSFQHISRFMNVNRKDFISPSILRTIWCATTLDASDKIFEIPEEIFREPKGSQKMPLESLKREKEDKNWQKKDPA